MNKSTSFNSASPKVPVPNEGIMEIAAYVPGESKINAPLNKLQKIYKLSANESALGPPASAVKAYQDGVANLALYPDGQASTLRNSIAKAYCLDRQNILCGNGSDELLGLIAHNYSGKGDEVIITEHAFSVYEIQSRAAGADVIKVPEKNCRIDVETLLTALTSKTKLVFIANPGNPTGTYLTKTEIAKLQQALPDNVLLVLDGAYSEFVDRADYESGLELVQRCQNVVMTRTFSKIYGLAGLRIGWMAAPLHIIDALERVRPPFNVTLPAQLAAAQAVEEHDFIAQAVAFNNKWRDWLAAKITALGLEVTPSVTNFLLIHFPDTPPKTAPEADEFLKKNGFILRRVTSYGFPNALRLSVGGEEANRGVVDALSAFMQQKIGDVENP